MVPVPEGNEPSTNEGADFDGDGDIDFAVGSALGSYVAVFHGDGAGGLVHRQNLEAGARVRGLCILDFENDGVGVFSLRGTFDGGDSHVDFAGVNAVEGTLAVYLGDGEGGLLLGQNDVLGGFPLASDLGDLDGDGDLDTVSSHFGSGRFEIHENDGGGSLAPLPGALEASEAASCAILHDRDNDGDLDISGIEELDDLLILFGNR